MVFLLSSLIFSFSPFIESLRPRGWAEQFLLSLLLFSLGGPCKTIFLSVIPSSVSASVFYTGASINEIINRPSLIFFSFFGDVSDMINSIFYHMKSHHSHS